MQVLENEANQKYNQLLLEWAYDPNYLDDLNADFPSFYGGAYINSQKCLVLQVTVFDDEVKNYFNGIIDLSNVCFEKVKYSYSDLKKAHSEIASKMSDSSDDSFIAKIAGVGFSIPDNSVSLYLIGSKTIEKTLEIQKEIFEKLTSFDHIRIKTVSAKDVPTATVQPGTKISYSNSYRSVGFWAKDSNDDLGVVTAPHSSLSSGTTMTIGSSTFGVAGTPYYSGNVDAVFVKRTNSSFSPSRYISGGSFSLGAGSSVGSTVYSKGVTSGYQSGQIVDNNYTTSYGISSCILADSTSAGGDSGGVVAAGGTSNLRYLAGIITGHQGGTNYLICVKALYILSTLNLTVY